MFALGPGHNIPFLGNTPAFSGIAALLSFAAYIAFLVFDLPQTMQAGNVNRQTLTGDLIGLFQALSVLFMIPIALALYQPAEQRAAVF